MLIQNQKLIMKTTKKLFIFILFLGLINNTLAQDRDIKILDSCLSKARNEWNVPGMAVGIIHFDKVVLSKGYGLKNIKYPNDSVSNLTVFPIASNTKSFTATALAMLVDEGKINWDDKVIQYLPYFKLYDDWVTKNFTIRDLLSHRSGLKTFSGDLLWYGSNYSREEVIKRASKLKPAFDFRTKFGYSNIMYIAAGEIIAKVSGMTYDDFINERIFKPLQMSQSSLSISKMNSNHCQPHNSIGDSVFPIDFVNWDNIGGAGVIISNVNDMLKYLDLQMNQGVYNNNQLFSKRQASEFCTPNINFNISPFLREIFPSQHFKGYSLGWNVSDYHGKIILSHSGGYDGVISFTCVVPEEKLGFVILTNSNSGLYNALNYKILDYFLSTDTTNWSEKFLVYQKVADKKSVEEKVIPIPPNLNLKSYTGKYHSEVYGDVLIKLHENELELAMLQSPIFIGKLNEFEADTFQIRMTKVPSLPIGKVYFKLYEKGGVQSLKINIPNPDFYFDEFEFIKED